MTDRQALLDAIRKAPKEETPYLIYADWLEEHNESGYAEFVRLRCELYHPVGVNMLAFSKATGEHDIDPRDLRCQKCFLTAIEIAMFQDPCVGESENAAVLKRRLIMRRLDEMMHLVPRNERAIFKPLAVAYIAPEQNVRFDEEGGYHLVPPHDSR